jgi:low affinity Fe/Cu permease
MRAPIFGETMLKCIPTTNHKTRKHNNDERDLFCSVQDAFHVFAKKSSNVLGSPWAFAIAILIILVWAATGPIFNFSDTWQLIINTGTTIVTFLMVFLIQNTQNRDAKAMHLKLDELIRAISSARNNLLDLEELGEDELKKLEEDFKRLRDRAASARSSRKEAGQAR